MLKLPIYYTTVIPSIRNFVLLFVFVQEHVLIYKFVVKHFLLLTCALADYSRRTSMAYEFRVVGVKISSRNRDR